MQCIHGREEAAVSLRQLPAVYKALRHPSDIKKTVGSKCFPFNETGVSDYLVFNVKTIV